MRSRRSWLVLAICCLTARVEAQAVGLRCLQAAYPGQVCEIRERELAMCDGQRFAYDDGHVKTASERLEDPDLEDQFAEPYEPARTQPPSAGSDPGRARYLPFFDAMYGATERAVRARLTRIAWMPSVSRQSVEVSTVNDVHLRLQEVSAELERLAPELRAHAAHISGTFSFRPIAGTERKSAHAYGIAIDVAPELSDYWRWREPRADPPRSYRNRMPLAIVRAFEAHGFIWGGRWSHYDTMHFEYRPELFVPACQAPEAPPPSAAASPARPWPTQPDSQALEQRIAPPPGFTRVALAADSFGAWLRELPLRAGRGTVRLHDGRPKPEQDLHVAVLDLDTGRRDLQQCADAVMRLRAEYLFSQGRAQEVCFRAASGDALPYSAYRQGLRPPPGRGGPWTARAPADASRSGFRSYLDLVFNIANSASLARELRDVPDPRAIEPGDVYIERANARRYGHAVLVLDVAENAAGERVFVIAQSYMPAQDVHVLINPNNAASSPWYRAPQDGSLITPEWSFPAGSLKRFGQSCSALTGGSRSPF